MKKQTPLVGNDRTEPNVVHINLNLNSAKKSNDLPGHSLKELRPVNSFKSPQIDIQNKLIKPENLKLGHAMPNSHQHKSNKGNTLTGNMIVQRMPVQRNSKLSELFGEIKLSQFPQSNATGSSILSQMGPKSSALNYMEHLMTSANEQT